MLPRKFNEQLENVTNVSYRMSFHRTLLRWSTDASTEGEEQDGTRARREYLTGASENEQPRRKAPGAIPPEGIAALSRKTASRGFVLTDISRAHL